MENLLLPCQEKNPYLTVRKLLTCITTCLTVKKHVQLEPDKLRNCFEVALILSSSAKIGQSLRGFLFSSPKIHRKEIVRKHFIFKPQNSSKGNCKEAKFSTSVELESQNVCMCVCMYVCVSANFGQA